MLTPHDAREGLETRCRRLLVDGVGEQQPTRLTIRCTRPPELDRLLHLRRLLVSMAVRTCVRDAVTDGVRGIRNVDRVIRKAVEHAAEDARHVAVLAAHRMMMGV